VFTQHFDPRPVIKPWQSFPSDCLCAFERKGFLTLLSLIGEAWALSGAKISSSPWLQHPSNPPQPTTSSTSSSGPAAGSSQHHHHHPGNSARDAAAVLDHHHHHAAAMAGEGMPLSPEDLSSDVLFQ